MAPDSERVDGVCSARRPDGYAGRYRRSFDGDRLGEIVTGRRRRGFAMTARDGQQKATERRSKSGVSTAYHHTFSGNGFEARYVKKPVIVTARRRLAIEAGAAE
jgi:hypothetical protein